MTLKQTILSLCMICFFLTAIGQNYDVDRITELETQLDRVAIDVPGLEEKLDITMQQASLSSFLLAISEVHKINMDVDAGLQGVPIVNNFKDVLVSDVLLYLCKTYDLHIDFTGSILFITNYIEEEEMPEERELSVEFNPTTNLVSIDLQNDNIAEAFRILSDRTGKGLFFTPDLASKNISAFIKDMPLTTAMEKIAYANDLIVTQTKDGSFEFEGIQVISSNTSNGNTNTSMSRPARPRRANFFFEVLDKERKSLSVDIQNVAVADIIYDIGNALEIDVFTATPLDKAGVASVKSKEINFDELLTKIFENTILASATGNISEIRTVSNQPLTGNSERFTFKKEGNVYYFGTYKQLTVRDVEVVPLRYRSLAILADPQRSGRTAGRGNQVIGISSPIVGFNSQTTNQQQFNSNNPRRDQNSNSQDQTSIDQLIPEELKQDLTILSDKELNSFIVSGASEDINRFKEFVSQIDKPVPVVVIEVMILEVNKNSTLDAGIDWGIAAQPSTTQGSIFPETGLTLGANTVNRILGRIDGSSFFNIGKVGPNFFANIRASESNGNFKIRSSPRIATLNGHRAYFSNGRTSYFEVTQNQFVGVQNPVVSESTNFVPIDAELSLEVLPFVSEDGEVTMDIKVIQSSFSGERITDTGPPEISSREFTSVIRSRTNDITVLGGLEENRKENSGSGVPFFARIPIIKWLFSKRVRTASKSKLTVLIKPTVIN